MVSTFLFRESLCSFKTSIEPPFHFLIIVERFEEVVKRA
jgi:hypothetical protein